MELNNCNSRILRCLDVDEGNFPHCLSHARLENGHKEDELNKESSEEDCCRICQNNENYPNELVSPCYCSGSLGKIHVTCLNQWLQLSKRKQCELCGYEYTFTKENRKFIDFLHDPELRHEIYQFIWNLVSFVLITLIFLLSICLILLHLHHLQWHLYWDVKFLVIFRLTQLFVNMVWLLSWFQKNQPLWDGWKDTHKRTKLVIQKTKAPRRKSIAGRNVKRN